MRDRYLSGGRLSDLQQLSRNISEDGENKKVSETREGVKKQETWREEKHMERCHSSSCVYGDLCFSSSYI